MAKRRGRITRKAHQRDRAVRDILATDNATAAKALTELAVPVPGRLRKFWLVEDIFRLRGRLGQGQ